MSDMKNNNVEALFRKHGGQLRMSEAMSLGLSRYRLYKLLDDGIVERVGRGLYRLSSLPPITNPDLCHVSSQFRNGVICLISALSFHHLTTQIPKSISVAVKRDSTVPSLKHPPVNVYLFSEPAFSAGIEEHKIDGTVIKIYNPEKTIADCFKYRNKIGMDVVLEALKRYLNNKNYNINKLLHFASICRVRKVMQPYIEGHL